MEENDASTTTTESEEVALFDASKKKKKKKAKKPSAAVTIETTAGTSGDEELPEAPAEGDIPAPNAIGEEGVEDEEDIDMGAGPQPTSNMVLSSTGDYSYDQLLKRAFDLIGQTKTEKPRIKIPPPQAFRIGTSRTLWANFPQIAKALHRNPQHLLNFVIVELGTTANLDGNGRVVIKGRFMPKQLESLVRKYLTEYVICKTCGSRDTILKKENRLHFLECMSSVCGSTRTVPPLNKGYVHNIRRKK